MKESNVKAVAACAPRLRAIIKSIRAVADDCCADGEAELSADLRLIEAKLTEAYSMGRRLKDEDGSVIVPMGGGK